MPLRWLHHGQKGGRLLLSRERPRLWHRVVVVWLIAGILLTSCPSNLFAFLANDQLRPEMNRLPLAASTTPPVTPNRTLPDVTPPSSTFSLPSPATIASLENARLFPEPLVAVGGSPSAAENTALAAALITYASSRDIKILEAYANANPTSPWLVSILTDLGLLEFNDGYFSKALADWKQAWTLGKSAKAPAAQAIVNRAVVELIKLNNRVGRVAESKALLAQLNGRTFNGLTALRIDQARQAVAQMDILPKNCFKCGPYAVNDIVNYLSQQTPKTDKAINDYVTTAKGTSLAQVLAFANEVGLKMQAAKRVSGTTLPLPAVVNWKLNHYGALLSAKGNRYLLVDPTFGDPTYVLQDAVNQETSGYFLIPAGPLPSGWVGVGAQEASTVWGRGDGGKGHKNCHTKGGSSSGGNKGKGKPDCPPVPKKNKRGKGGKGGGKGSKSRRMAEWSFDTSYATLNVTDTPLYYQPPVGSEISFDINYDSGEENQPATINYSNLGPLWNFSWLSSITFDSADAFVNMGSGGLEDYVGFNSSTQSYLPDPQSHCVLVEISPTDYERQDPDGSKMVFALADPSGRLYMTQMVDPQGITVNLTYDANFRLMGITDAIGQVTTLTYGSNTVGDANFYLITKVTDPFGRFASFVYNGSGELIQSTDQMGMISQFGYGASNLMQTLTTPYGTTSFALTVTTTQANGQIASLVATEPNGAQQRIDAVEVSTVTPESESVTPTGVPLLNTYLEDRNSYYWDRKAMHDAPGDYSKAELTHFLHYGSNVGTESDIIESTKEPLENRIWYYYQGQTTTSVENPGMLDDPTSFGSVLDDGTSQVYSATYNALGYPTQDIDPLGRTTNYTYATNGIDLLTVRQVNGASSDLLASFTWNAQHLPLTMASADNETTTFTYNNQGEVLTVTDPKNETSTLGYNAQGYLTSFQGPMAGNLDKTAYTYDSFGRIQTITDGEDYVLTLAYDALNRLISATYPDGTSDQIVYTYQQPTEYIDRLGRIDRLVYNSLQQLISETDPLERTTQYTRCQCGALLKEVDPLGQTTTWTYDIESRPTSKTYADGSKETYAYEKTTSRLKSVTDAKGQKTSYSYNIDDTIAARFYTNVQAPTPDVSYNYDPSYLRVTAMTDGIGKTAYTYYPVTGGVSPGANQLATVNGPWNNSLVSYVFDALGRVLSRSINGVAQTMSYDVLGRVPTLTNALGTFNYTYQDASERILSFSRPNGQVTNCSYFGNTGDRRLQQIVNLNVNGANLSAFTYTYNEVGDIVTWSQQTDANAAVTSTLAYDAADQLLSSTATGQTRSYTYDAGANRLTQTVNGATSTASYNPLNELQQVSPALGNDKTYTWDAEDRMVGIKYTGTNLSTRLSYDGLNRCVQIVELNGSTVTSTKRFVWCDLERCEEHDALDNLTRRFFVQGEQVNGTNYFYTADHMGSIREMTDSTGTLHARYSYDPYGTRTKASGDLDASLGFTGLYYHVPSALQLADFRAYDSVTGRWLSRDPLVEEEGLNLYAYLENNVVNNVDPTGESGFQDIVVPVGGFFAKNANDTFAAKGDTGYLQQKVGEAERKLAGDQDFYIRHGPTKLVKDPCTGKYHRIPLNLPPADEKVLDDDLSALKAARQNLAAAGGLLWGSQFLSDPGSKVDYATGLPYAVGLAGAQ